MKRVINIVIPAACSVIAESAWAHEAIVRKSAKIIPARIRSIVQHICEEIDRQCRVRIGPEVCFQQGQVQFQVTLNFDEDNVGLDLESLKKALEAELAGSRASETASQDPECADASAAVPSAAGRKTGEVLCTVDAAFAPRLDYQDSCCPPDAVREGNPTQDTTYAYETSNQTSGTEDEEQHRVFYTSDELELRNERLVEEIVEGCEKVVGAYLEGHGFPMVLIRSSRDAKCFCAGKNLSSQMTGAGIKQRGLWILETVKVTD